MFKKVLAIVLVLTLAFAFAGCGKTPVEPEGSVDQTSSEQNETPAINALTGLPIDKEMAKNRPVAVMINNISVAQAVQTGLNSFDILYETEVEGGITRMMGVTKNIAAMPQMGTVRSARVPYLELALGHDAVYVHAGLDYTYFAPLKEQLGVTTIDINGPDAKYGFRDHSNGLASEHTLYTTGEKLSAAIDSRSVSRTTEENHWLNFADEENPVVPTAPCTTLTVPFSGSYITGFTYDAESGKYTKNSNGTEKTDYVTGQKLKVKNIFVLFTDIAPYPDGKHMEVKLSSGTGYYVSNGGYQEIKWVKGDSDAPIVITNADGSAFTANAGNSYVCIVKNEQQAKVKFATVE